MSHFRQVIEIAMGTNCTPLLDGLFLYSYETEFLNKLTSKGKRKLALQFNLTYRYIDDIISFGNKIFHRYLSQIYPKELQIKHTTELHFGTHYLDLTFMRGATYSQSSMTNGMICLSKLSPFHFFQVTFPLA